MMKQENKNEIELAPNEGHSIKLDKKGHDTLKGKSKLDKDIVKWCRDLNEKISVAPLTTKEKELLQKTLVKDGLDENDFAVMSMRRVLGSKLSATRLHDERRPLPL